MFAIELDEVENIIKQRRLLYASHLKRLEQLERRATLFIQCDNFAIQHGLFGRKFFEWVEQFVIFGAKIFAGARYELDFEIVFDGEGANAVEFQLVDPIGAFW